MIDTEGIPNWRRWEAKESRGINRGYSQAYINEERADHFVLISQREFEFKDEHRVTVKLCDNGDWKGGKSDDAETFEETISEADDLLEQAEECAREWMRDHPCERDGECDDIELLTDIFEACRDEGLVPQHDASLSGWTRPGHHDGTTQNVRAFEHNEAEETLEGARPSEADVLSFHLKFDGKESGLRFKETVEADSDGETRTMHDPKDQSKLHGDIEAAFHEVGFEEVAVENAGHQRHWDYGTSYRIRVVIPEDIDLALPDSKPWETKRRRRRVF